MKNHLFIAFIASSLLLCSCSPSSNAEVEEQASETEEKTGPIEDTTSTDSQKFSSSQELSLQGITLSISATNDQPTNSVVIKPKGLEVSNDPQTIEIAGGFIRAESEDMNSDGSPEFILFFNSYGEDPEEFAIGFSVNNLKSMSRVSIPPLDEVQKQGYHGGGEMAIVETKLVRRFPIYEQRGDTWEKTGKIRQLQYSLKEGEAMRQFVLDKAIEY